MSGADDPGRGAAPAWDAVGPFERRVTARGLEYRSGDGRHALLLTGLEDAVARVLPERPARLGLRREPAGWCLDDGVGRWPLAGADWRAHEGLPAFHDAVLARYAPSPRERRIVAGLLALLRIPGTAGLIRAWHARRAR